MGSVINNVTDAVGLTNHGGDAAISAQTNAANAANATQQQMYNMTRGDLSPYREVGSNAIGQLQNNLPSLLQSYSGQDLQNDPGYQFGLNQGMNTLQNSAAARGNLNSGATLKALQRYGQDYAGTKYNEAYNRFNNDRQMKYNMLSALAGMGQNAAAQTGSAGSNAANQIASNQIGIGNAQAANDVAASNRMGGLIGQVGGMALGGYLGGSKGVVSSDRRIKTDITPVSPKDLAELKSVIKPYHFKYLLEGHGKGDFVGVMAQDLEKSKIGRMAVFEENGIKKINVQKLASILLASMAEEAA